MLKINIPEPCHENWDAMTPKDQGRFCGSCCKTVVDFTTMSDLEVQMYLINKSGEKICGRFNNTQLDRIVISLPENIFIMRIPYWKKFLAACLIVFSTTLFSCETKTTGDVIIQKQERTMGIPIKASVDTTTLPTTHTDKEKCTTIGAIPLPPEVIKGGIMIEPIEQVTPPDQVTPARDSVPLVSVTQGKVMMVAPVKDSLPARIPAKDSLSIAPDILHIKMGTIAYVPPANKKDPPKKDEGDCDKKVYY